MNTDPQFHIVLHSPEIPGNTGSIGRTCVALNIDLILIGKCAFDLSEKAVRRAGLDYWKYVKLTRYDTWEEFLEKETPKREDLFFFSKVSEQTYYKAGFKKNAYLIFGCETKGLPAELTSAYQDRLFSLPMYSEHIRSLNLANAATAVAYEALRQIEFSS